MSETVAIQLDVNGDKYDVSIEPRRLLADVLREDCGLTGTHLGCEHGVCGACTVLLDDQPVRACLIFAVQAQGRRLRTVESLGAEDSLHPLQQAFIDHHAIQCGFCTPGMLMLALPLYEDGRSVTPDEITETLSANLCRCTGYARVVQAVQAALSGREDGLS